MAEGEGSELGTDSLSESSRTIGGVRLYDPGGGGGGGGM
jgi:hypothetical protein